MNIENLKLLINGDGMNTPSVTSVVDFSFEAKNICQGYAYIAMNSTQEDINEAISNGAYAVLIDEECEISDKEVAFIRVDNLNTAIMRLVRFESSSKALKFCSVNPVQKAILKRISLAKNAAILPTEIKELFIKIFHAKNGDTFFCDDLKILSKVAPFYDTAWTDMTAQAINEGSIFFTTLICDKIYYQNLAVAKVFKGFLAGLIQYLNKNEIGFKLGDLRGIEHFEPVFVDRNFKITPFGASFRAFITENDDSLFEMEANFLRRNFSEMIEICVPKDFKSNLEPTFVFSDLSELKELKNFRYALVKCQRSQLEAMLNQAEKEKNLFGF
ncbi:ferrochelatase [Campylobacter sp.]|uniref:ferrochelatase n=1 Tax=Campylobacter sp. TaxID=205 RepID=UPI0026F85305|nr:ferrochelatase [Campylobacter sp.]